MTRCRGPRGQESAINDAQFDVLKVLVEEDDEDLFTYFEEYVEKAGQRRSCRAAPVFPRGRGGMLSAACYALYWRPRLPGGLRLARAARRPCVAGTPRRCRSLGTSGALVPPGRAPMPAEMSPRVFRPSGPPESESHCAVDVHHATSPSQQRRPASVPGGNRDRASPSCCRARHRRRGSQATTSTPAPSGRPSASSPGGDAANGPDETYRSATRGAFRSHGSILSRVHVAFDARRRRGPSLSR